MDWDERYAIYGRPFGEQPNAFVQQVMDDDGFAEVLGSASRILCPGDGYGRNGLALAQRGHRVLGLDISATATRDARARAMETAADATFLTADLSGAPYPLAPDDVFDAVVSVWFRLPERSARKAWNRAAIGHLTSRGALVDDHRRRDRRVGERHRLGGPLHGRRDPTDRPARRLPACLIPPRSSP